MARLRKEKRHSTKEPSVSEKVRLNHQLTRKSGGTSGISKRQILALGGDEQDYGLVNDIQDAGSAEEDVCNSIE